MMMVEETSNREKRGEVKSSGLRQRNVINNLRKADTPRSVMHDMGINETGILSFIDWTDNQNDD